MAKNKNDNYDRAVQKLTECISDTKHELERLEWVLEALRDRPSMIKVFEIVCQSRFDFGFLRKPDMTIEEARAAVGSSGPETR